MTDGRKDILIIMGRYLPGYKDGGPVRSIKNLTDFLGIMEIQNPIRTSKLMAGIV